MKISDEKLEMTVNVFTPILMLLLIFSSYLFIPAKRQRDEGNVGMEQVIEKKNQLPVFKSYVEFKKVKTTGTHGD